MAAVSVYSCALILQVLCTFFVSETSGTSPFLYHSDQPIQEDFHYLEIAPLREKRYVFDQINKLADNYDKGQSTKDLKKTDHELPKTQAEFIGSVAIRGEPETAPPLKKDTSPSPPPPAPSEKEPITTVAPNPELVPPKISKKPTVKNPKKDSDVQIHDSLNNNGTKPVNGTPDCGENDNCDDFPKEVSNNTLVRNNITVKQEDFHSYYSSHFLNGEKEGRHYWVDLKHEKGVIVSEMLSKSHRRAATIRLKFDFPFYGHIVRNMTVATGGFIYTGDYIHSWLAATQYIAPLMANFDTSVSADSLVKYRDNGTSFTVEWDSVVLQDKKEAGPFTFQVTLHKNGDIVFVYKDIPILVENIEDTQHPVKVGISDAYIIDQTVILVRKKTIFEYHRVLFNHDDIKNWTVIYLKALPTCLDYKDCNSCATHNTSFDCKWCHEVGRCSAGYDRHFQDWMNNNCQHTAVTSLSQCSLPAQRSTSQAPLVVAHSKAEESRDTRLGHSGMLGIFVVIVILTALGLWVFHAYRNPHTRFGQILIKYRPSQWSMRRGEARYTAASIHM